MPLTYPERGASARPGPLPKGYHHLRHRARLGHGRAAFERAGAALTGWAVHRGAGVRIAAGAARAEPGVTVDGELRAGPLRFPAPCEVVWSTAEPNRIGFAYGTRPGHPECGEESFLIELDPDGSVWFTIAAFSRPARWYTRLAGPLTPLAQRLIARRYARAARRLAG
ncbi:DUF1990 family protein [Kitasatospora sp. MMS16-BH015]|uniref:DUF1990 family protein n=1 Tax=Kitasatospora sp. MMS16-BH015 TaxID=2018025 RepID=UPI000CF2F59F|nr:DUF1990 domain-containing protein [Kitasatospora sp. MMS16-BH015]